MSLIKSKQLNLPLGSIQAMHQAFGMPAGKSVTVTSKFNGRSAVGIDGVGVPTSSPYNYVSLRNADTGKDITDKQGVQVFGRLTESAGVWTITFFKSDGSGGEAEHTFSDEPIVGTDVTIRFGEVKQIKDINPLSVVMGLDTVDESDIDPNSHRPFAEQINAVNNQTTIPLGHKPKFPSAVSLLINGVNVAAHIGVSESTLTFDAAGIGYALESDDVIMAIYDY